MRRMLIATLGAALLLGTVPAGASHGDIHPTFREEPVYFECVGGDANKLQNLDSPAPWSTTAPDRSVEDGAGCAVVDPGAFTNEAPDGGEYDAAFAGESVGNLTNLTVELYVFPFTNLTAPVVADPQVWINARLVIDGVELLNPSDVIQIDWVEGNSGLTQRAEFTVVGLDSFFATEDGHGEEVRDVSLTIGHDFDGEVGTWAWGTSEVPAGITFNDTSPAVVTVMAGG